MGLQVLPTSRRLEVEVDIATGDEITLGHRVATVDLTAVVVPRRGAWRDRCSCWLGDKWTCHGGLYLPKKIFDGRSYANGVSKLIMILDRPSGGSV